MRLLLSLILYYVFIQNVFTRELDGTAILAKVDMIMNAETSISIFEMKIIRPNCSDRIYKMKMFQKGNDKILIRFLVPPRLVGRSFLRDSDNMWLYMPQISKYIMLSPKQLLLGGDFSNADMLRISLVDDYHVTEVHNDTINNERCYRLKLKAKDRSITYDKALFWIKKDNYFPVKLEFYTLSGKLLKILTYEKPIKIGNHVHPAVLIMENTLKIGHKTVMTYLEKENNIEISDYIFKKQQLERHGND